MTKKRRYFRQLGKSFRAAGRRMLRHEAPRDAGGIAYFCLIALFPAILVLIALVDTFLGWMNLHNVVIESIIDLFPGSPQFLRANLNDLTTPSTTVLISCLFVVLWSSSWIFTFIESSINRAWGISNQRTFWESRLRGIALMALGVFCLLSSAAITAIVGAARASTIDRMVASANASYFLGWFWSLVLIGTGLLIAILVFSLIFKWTPHCRVLWKEALSGALISTILWQIGSFLFMKYVPFFKDQRIYGRMGAIIALLAWVYTSNLIMLFGANISAQMHWKSVETSSAIPKEKPGSFSSHS
jgi:membrane protein